MATETQPHVDIDMFAFRPPEMASILRLGGHSPRTGSPLRRLPPDVDAASSDMARNVDRSAREAVLRVACPDRVVGLTTAVPPQDAEYFWLYSLAGDLDYAFHLEDETGTHRLAWPVDGVAMLDLAVDPIDLIGYAEPGSMSLTLGRDELATLAAIADFVQLDGLQDFLRQTPATPDPPPITLGDLAGFSARSTRSGDLRWMVPRMVLMAPIPLDFGTDTLESGLASFVEQGLLFPEDGSLQLAPQLHQASLVLRACTGFTAMSSRQRVPGSDVWDMEHFAVARAPDSMLLFEFSAITPSDFHVAIDDVTPDLAWEWIQGTLLVDEPPVAGERDDELAEDPVGGQHCAQCGTALSPGKRFCTHCGEAVHGTGENG